MKDSKTKAEESTRLPHLKLQKKKERKKQKIRALRDVESSKEAAKKGASVNKDWRSNCCAAQLFCR